MIYSLSSIKTIETNGFHYVLDEKTKTNIIKLTSSIENVTPFDDNYFDKLLSTLKPKKNTHTHQRFGNLSGGGFKDNNKFKNANNDNNINFFNSKIKFKTQLQLQTQTTTNPKKSIDNYILNVRNNLNKLTDKNYNDIKQKIFLIIDETYNDNEFIDEDYNRLGNIIFEISTNNKFYSKIYADLYSELYNKYDFIKNVFNINFNSYYKMFENIEYIDSTINNENYDKFCSNNLMNEKRKSLSGFLLYLCKNGIFEKQELFNVIVKLMETINVNINNKQYINENHEITENIIILFDLNFFSECSNNTPTLLETIHKIAKSGKDEYLGISNKTKFKYMSLIGI